MGVRKLNSAVFIHFLVSFGLGLAAAVGCAAALASLMAAQGMGDSMVWPFATAAVSAGSLLSGWLMGFMQKSRGLLWGAAQGGLYSALLLAQTAANGTVPDERQLLRLGLIVLFGAIGGYLGLLNTGKKRHY